MTFYRLLIILQTSNGVKDSLESDDEASEASEIEDNALSSSTRSPLAAVSASASPSSAPASLPPALASITPRDITTRSAVSQDTTTPVSVIWLA